MKPVRLYSVGNRWLFAYLAFLSAFAPISTDMYLPALPHMAETYQVSNGVISLTISLFLLVFGSSMLFWGPMADRHGRRPILLIGSSIFLVSSVTIALSENVATLFIWRCVQACGAGAASCLALAIVKDILRGGSLEKALIWMQAATILAPMIAPVLGGGALMLVSWRGIFWLLALCGLIAFLGALPLRETASKFKGSGPLENFKRIGLVLKIGRFRSALLLFSMSAMPFMTFLAVSAFIYQDQFGQNPQAYSLFFAFNAFSTLLGPFAHMRFFRGRDRGRVIYWQFALMAASGLAITLAGGWSMWLFALLFATVSFCGSAMRPPSTVIIMSCVQGDNGIVASLINFGHVLFGSLAMFMAALPFWPKPTFAVGVIAFIISGACALWWRKIRKNY